MSRSLKSLLTAGLVAGCCLAEASAGEILSVPLDQAVPIRLAVPAGKVIVGQPGIADVTLESPTLITVFGKQPGQTNLLVLGDGERMLIDRTIVVGTAAGGLVSVHVPGQNGPASRDYACGGGSCLRMPSSGQESGPASVPAPVPAMASAPPPTGR